MDQMEESNAAGPVAIVGMSCRLPGGVNSPSDLWSHLVEGRSGQGDIPSSRFSKEAFYHPNPEHSGTINGTGGYFLQNDVRLFDNKFFGINNLEAKYMDPQQRQLLEVVYECLENAGESLQSVSGANVGCYVANFTSDYTVMQAQDPDLYHRYSATGFGPTILANRISHVFNLRGPSFVLDTACSSSLYALHMACQALNAHDCDAAIVAGANLIQSPEVFVAMAKAGVLSGTSTSHTFDTAADGYGRGEGIAALYLKRMDSVIGTLDPIRSVIRGTAVNSNGHTPGITLPGVEGQEAVIRKAYAAARLDTRDTIYVEAHGTGTPVGDPIEVHALSNAFRTTSRETLLIGSNKPNVGHGEAVSGLTSIIKATLALEHKCIPPTRGIENVSPELKLAERNIDIVRSPLPWPTGSTERISVNAFGYGGANSHTILDSAAMYLTAGAKHHDSDFQPVASVLLPISAHCPESLAKNMESMTTLDLSPWELSDVSYTVALRRSRLPYRSYMIGTSTDTTVQISPNLGPSSNPTSEPLLAFVFTGQGAQWPGMSRQLLGRFPVYRCVIDDLDAHLRTLPQAPSWTIRDTILDPETNDAIYKASRSQTVCTAVQIALVELLAHWGAAQRVQAVVGHSSGEIGAAFAAGHLSAHEALAIAYYRGLLSERIQAKGSMLAVGLSAEETSKLLSDLGVTDSVQVACVNSNESTTVSGEYSAVDSVFQALQDRNIFVRKLKTDGRAYHSHLMQIVGEEYESLLDTVLRQATPEAALDANPDVKMFSTVTARMEIRDSLRKASYWRSNLESPVLFKDALALLIRSNSYHIVEVGPHPALGGPVKAIVKSIPEQATQYSSSLFRGKPDDICMLQLAGHLFMAGVELDMSNINDTVSLCFSEKSRITPTSTSHGGSVNGASDSGIEDMNYPQSQKAGIENVVFKVPRIDITDPSTTSETDTRFSFAVGHFYRSRVFQRLPPYAWHYEAPSWTESRQSFEFRNNKHRKHDLLGSRVPATPGHLALWRNQLKLTNAPWIKDHKLGSTIVFPAAGYIAMALEALLQVSERPCTGVVTLRHVHLMNMLVLSTADKEAIEVSTVLEPERISQTATSNLWWRFQISSFASGSSTIHASGLIGLRPNISILEPKFKYPKDFGTEEQALRTVYNRLSAQGLCFGSEFQSLKSIFTDRHRKASFAGSEVSFRNGGGQGKDVESNYVLHPVTIDSILQTAIVASCKGACGDLYGKVPVEVGSLEITLENLPPSAARCSIRASCTRVGFDAVLLGGELEAETTGRIVAQVNNVRAINYRETTLAAKSTLQRNPALRVLWKPDISTISQSSCDVIQEYADRFPQYLSKADGWAASSNHVCVAAVFDLMTHKNGRMAVLEICEEIDTAFSDLVQKLSMSQAPKRYQTYTRGCVDDSGSLRIFDSTQKTQKSSYDLIIVPSSRPHCTMETQKLAQLLSTNGALLFIGEDKGSVTLSKENYNDITIVPKCSSNTLTLARRVQTPNQANLSGPIVLVHDGNSDKFNDALDVQIREAFQHVAERLHVDDLTPRRLSPNSVVISTLELSSPFLSTMDPKQQGALTTLAENASVLMWVTGGGLFKSGNPEAATILGLARTLMLERPSLRMPVLDVDTTASNMPMSSKNAIAVLQQVLQEPNPDLEYREYKGALYISRFVPDVSRNQAFRHTQDAKRIETRIGDVGYARLGMAAVGQIDTLRFEQDIHTVALKPGYLRVEVQAVGMNAKDLYALSDKINIKNSTCGLEFSGTVTSVGSPESKFVPGERVVVMAPHNYATIEDVPEWACCKLKDHESSAVMATIPLVFSTALYALEHRARLEDGQSILIHSGAGGLGMAAIQIAKMLGADVFTTVGTPEKRAFLSHTFGIPEDHIFDSRSNSFVKDLLSATSGKGVDVVLNSLTGDLLHESWEALAPFGTFVEVGKRDIADSGRLNMRVFERAATFTAFDLTDLFWAPSEKHTQVWSRLLQRTVNLFRSGQIKPVSPLKVFPATEVVQAFRYFASGKRMGKVAVSFDKDQTMQVVPFKYHTRFDPHKSYLLVGCLGGLGRSISRWMFQLGARHFTFLGRSGTDKAPAAQLVNDLTTAGAVVTVCRGSVADRAVVQSAVDSSTRPIGGVIQASMAIHVSLFKDMDNSTWHAGINQKIQGTWNLHHALFGHDSQLDFFLMLSSITGSVGTATESNYCAANSFLDAFGSYRRSLGLPAVSLGLGMISEVGFLHENPSTEAALLRKGVHPFTEAELLQIIDLSLKEFPTEPSAAVDEGVGLEHQMQGHILTGLELHGFQRIRDQGFVRGTKVLEDPRCTYVAGAFSEDTEAASGDHTPESGSRLPHAVSVALTESRECKELSEALVDAVEATVVKQIASLLLVSKDILRKETLLAEFGMESMLAAEFRSDMYRAFNVDVPFAVLLDRRTQVVTVAKVVAEALLQAVS